MNTPPEIPQNIAMQDKRQSFISNSAHAAGIFLIKKVRGILEYRPTRKEIIATVGVLAATGTCMYIEDLLTTDVTEKIDPAVDTTPHVSTTSLSPTTTILVETSE